jgi:hypothetical protein
MIDFKILSPPETGHQNAVSASIHEIGATVEKGFDKKHTAQGMFVDQSVLFFPGHFFLL